jgi:predicted phosphodiesterase
VRVAAIYDIHGNLPALEAVLDEIRQAGVNQIVVGGDVVPGPMARETVARLLALETPIQFIYGNGEVAVLAVMSGREPGDVPEQFRPLIRHAAQDLGPDHHATLASWLKTLLVRVDGLGDVLFCHATPRNENEVFTRLTPDDRVAPMFAGVKAAMVVCGHTHMQFDRQIGTVRVVNAGSVGMPFGAARAHWLLLGPDVQLRQTAYDLEQAAVRIRATNYPQAEQFAVHSVLEPPSEQQMLEVFTYTEPTTAP